MRSATRWTVFAVFAIGIFLLVTGPSEKEALREQYAKDSVTLLPVMKSDYESKRFLEVIAAGKKYETVSEGEFNGLYWEAVKAEAVEQEANRRSLVQQEFTLSRDILIKDMKSHLSIKDYSAAGSLVEKYKFIKDTEFEKLSKQAAKGIEVERLKAAKEQARITNQRQQSDNVAAFQTEMEKGSLRAIGQTLCESEVKKSLRSPSTADFPWTGGTVTLYPSSGTIVFSSYVDAQNGFGATLRTNYACTLKFEGNNASQVGDVLKWAVTKVETY